MRCMTLASRTSISRGRSEEELKDVIALAESGFLTTTAASVTVEKQL